VREGEGLRRGSEREGMKEEERKRKRKKKE
jgi:hypothetical protein